MGDLDKKDMGDLDKKDPEAQNSGSNQFVTKEEFKQLQEQITGVQIKAKNQSKTLEEKLNKQGDNISKILEALSPSNNTTHQPDADTPPSDVDFSEGPDTNDISTKIDLLRQNQKKALEQQDKQILTLKQQLEESRRQAELTQKEAVAARQKTSWLTAAKDLTVNPDMMYELVKSQSAIIPETEDVVVNTGRYDVNAEEIRLRGSEAVKYLLSLPQYSNYAIPNKPKPSSGHVPGSGSTPPTRSEQITLKDEMSKVFQGLKI